MRLQRLQNRAARIVFRVSRRHSSSPLLKTLHWLPIDNRIKYKILTYVYKTLNGLSPNYLSDCISIRVPSRTGLRSSQDKTCLEIPRCKKQIGDRSFRVYGPTLWNKLPQSLRTSPSINVFKHNLKTYLFQ